MSLKVDAWGLPSWGAGQIEIYSFICNLIEIVKHFVDHDKRIDMRQNCKLIFRVHVATLVLLP
jgi:hypothetical protein